MVFLSSQTLDKQGFVIEHEAIDASIQKLMLNGSCEQMAVNIVNTVKNLLTGRLGGVMGIKVTIFPQPEGQAHVSYIYVKNKEYLPLINS